MVRRNIYERLLDAANNNNNDDDNNRIGLGGADRY
jgi:hypothetical protein